MSVSLFEYSSDFLIEFAALSEFGKSDLFMTITSANSIIPAFFTTSASKKIRELHFYIEERKKK